MIFRFATNQVIGYGLEVLVGADYLEPLTYNLKPLASKASVS